MPFASDYPIRNLTDIERFEREKPFAERCSARGIYDVFAQAAERFSTRTALTMVMTGAADEIPREISYAELLGGVTRAANLFSSLGGPRPGVAFMLPSLIETHFVLWGAEVAGYALPVNFLLQSEHIAHLIKAADIKILVALGPHPNFDIWQKALSVRDQVGDLALVQLTLPGVVAAENVTSFAEASLRHSGHSLEFGTPETDDGIAAYYHTGGTTGAPKLVAHTHRNQIVAAFGGAVLFDLSENDVVMTGLPLFHVAGTISHSLSMFMAGVKIVILSPGGLRNPAMLQNFWRIIERYRVTIGGGIPTVMSALLNVPVGEADISSLRFSPSGAAAPPKVVIEQFEARTGKRVHDCFGMTESGGLISMCPAASEPVVGSVGYRIPYTKASIRKTNADGSLGAECAPREVGVLAVSGPHVTPGYREQRHNEGVIVGGVLNSGDLAYLDEEGRIYIAGRMKDVIIRSGHNIDPHVIEDAVLLHPAVSAAAAVGQPDKYAGELPICYVTLHPGKAVSADELRAFAEPLISERPAWPKNYYIVDAIPVTGVGKVFKPSLRIDAARRLVEKVVADELKGMEARVAVRLDKERGTAIDVLLPPRGVKHRPAIDLALSGYLFEYTVNVSDHEFDSPDSLLSV